MLKIKSNIITKPSELEGFILKKFGIECNVITKNNKHYIKVNNHLSLFKLVSKIRKKFDFEIYHKKEKNEFILLIK